nr:hypothetical protein [Nostoc sp. NMS7]
MSSKTSKVGVIGAGNVSADVANALVLLRKCVRVVLFDRTLSKAEGQAWDIEDSIPLLQETNTFKVPLNHLEITLIQKLQNMLRCNLWLFNLRGMTTIFQFY